MLLGLTIFSKIRPTSQVTQKVNRLDRTIWLRHHENPVKMIENRKIVIFAVTLVACCVLPVMMSDRNYSFIDLFNGSDNNFRLLKVVKVSSHKPLFPLNNDDYTGLFFVIIGLMIGERNLIVHFVAVAA